MKIRFSKAPCAFIACLTGSLFLGGCITHRATVKPPAIGEQQTLVSAMAGTSQKTATTYQQSSAFPEEIPATLWLRDQDGNLLRGDVIVQTARPWWQRFPVDAITDLLPIDFTVHAEATIEVQPIAETSPAELDAAAIHFGYASDSQSK